jgi:hypothetical protein
MYLCAVYVNISIQTLFNIRDLNIKIEDSQIHINGYIFCDTSDLVTVIIQPSYGGQGLGMSFTLGLKSKTKTKPILHFLGERESKTMAEKLANFLTTDYTIRKPLLFRALSKW